MSWLQVVVLAVVQGFTEFLPISSSAHLILVSHFFGWAEQSLAFDVAVHGGSLLAVIFYFREDLWRMAAAVSMQLRGRPGGVDARLAWLLVIATCPAGLVGLLFEDGIETHLRSVAVIAYATIGFALLLWLAERFGSGRLSDLRGLNISKALLIGCGQIFALIPGASRAGVVISAGLLCGMTREAAARFSFLMGVPIIGAACALKTIDLAQEAHLVRWDFFAAGVVISAVTAYLSIYGLLRLIVRISFLTFIVYRLALGAFLLIL